MNPDQQQNTYQNNETYEFISETIKKRPVNKRRVVLKTLFTIFSGLLFGAVACFTFVWLYPKVQPYFQVAEVNEIRLNTDSLAEPEPTSAPVPSEISREPEEKKEPAPAEKKEQTAPSSEKPSDEEQKPDQKTADEVTETGKQEQEEPDTKNRAAKTVSLAQEEDEKASQEDEKTPLPESEEPEQTAVVTVSGKTPEAAAPMEKQLEINDYTLLYQKIGDVAEDAKKAMVTVTGVFSDSDWFQSSYESRNQTAGLILADNGKELLILARTSVVKDADSILVTFCDGKRYPASLKKSDNNVNLSVVAVELELMDEDTREAYEMAELGSSSAKNIKGCPVIAIGDPQGVSDSIAIGQITSNSIVVDKADSNVSILTTDIYGSTNASGVLCDFDGKVLGIICHDGTTADTKNLIRGYSISDLKTSIEKILNGQDLAYLGIQGTDVTDEISDLYGIPKGAYVKQVVPDSPAMKAGIQNGDVIVKMGTNDITSFSDYRDAILRSQPKDISTVTVKRLGKEEYVDISYEIVLDKL
ncbi:MAG: PDZ domain-containing protein [Lachnospiraceae bacterium]|nr:PDZ domain-containing protein [Lachnospiraceae bacterium]